ncbi:SRPBCC family protein [Rhodococcus sp. HM1]|uniref:SRPBCC family protein n=1 Tax=Rhodococcus sp. HM1 TaxID=2937759 RepID=UPI00200AD4A2|nr:SRPBCC family protein [Rhodococcus sp. HM1]MCK8672787.1 SRPBCC family protein [Rhodococcus sp. HM1]
MASLDITRSIDIQAPIAKVWAALTEPELIAQWFGDTAEFDPKPGGVGSFGWTNHDEGPFRVLVEHVDEPKTLIYRWARESNADPVPGNSTLVRFDLAEIDGGTRLTLVETGFEELAEPRSAHDGNVEGWQAELGDLVEYVEAR